MCVICIISLISDARLFLCFDIFFSRGVREARTLVVKCCFNNSFVLFHQSATEQLFVIHPELVEMKCLWLDEIISDYSYFH